LENQLKQYLNNERETFQYHEALNLLEFYTNCMNKYMSPTNSTNLYLNLFKEIIDCSNNLENENVSLKAFSNLLNNNRVDEFIPSKNLPLYNRNINNLNGSSHNLNYDNPSLNINNLRNIIDSCSPNYANFANVSSFSPILSQNNAMNGQFYNNSPNNFNGLTNCSSINHSRKNNLVPQQNNQIFSDFLKYYCEIEKDK